MPLYAAACGFPRKGVCIKARTINNRMELTAAIRSLEALTRPCAVTLHVDSTYVMKAFTEGWLASWRRNGWKTNARKPVANRELWELLEAQVARHEVTWVWVRGHAGDERNERVDALAVAAAAAAAG
jgi:ribonuclease HI